MKLFPVCFLLLGAHLCYSQQQTDFLIATQMDLIKSDYDGYFQKTQVGLEANYFISEKFTASAGLEFWTRDGVTAAVGTRWYPSRDAFIRARALFGSFGDVSIGGGWAKPMSETLRFESMADFYFAGNYSIRIGLAYLIRGRG
jgi:hypothetical protein